MDPVKPPMTPKRPDQGFDEGGLFQCQEPLESDLLNSRLPEMAALTGAGERKQISTFLSLLLAPGLSPPFPLHFPCTSTVILLDKLQWSSLQLPLTSRKPLPRLLSADRRA